MADFWFTHQYYNYNLKVYETKKIAFNTVYKDEIFVDGILKNSYGIWKYDGENIASLEAKADGQIPGTAEDGVLSVKTTFESEFDFSSSGELISYSPSRITLFLHWESTERDYSYELGGSYVFADNFTVNYKNIIDGNEDWYYVEEEASYIDFYYHSEGLAFNDEYAYKVRNTFDDESDRAALASFEGVPGDFDNGWWNTIDLTGDYQYIGTTKDDVLKAWSGDNFGADLIDGRAGDDELYGFRGRDNLIGGVGDDLIRAGNGRDLITGGPGEDVMYGGFGLNTFQDSDDGDADQIFFKSDQHAYNWIYDKDGNSPNGEKADKIGELDEFDEIFVQGVETEELSFGNVVHYSNLGETLDGIGIYASGTLEAVYVGDDLSLGQIESMTQGIL